MNKGLVLGLAIAVLAVVAAVYLPVVNAGFVWDDWPSFRDLRGDQWAHYVFRDFNQWTMYFRPLVVAFLALQIKLFHAAPGPMHVVSLALHLVNVALVGALAFRVGSVAGIPDTRRTIIALLCMLVYGLHPALIETVSWIGCQFDLTTTLLILLGLLANISIERPAIRAAVLSVLFFLATGAKETGVVFPMLVALFDAALFSGTGTRSIIANARVALRRNGIAYAGMLAAAMVYLTVRHWALDAPGKPPMFGPVNWLERVQEICFTYLYYIKVIFWPMANIGPLHPKNPLAFQTITIRSVLACLAVAGIVCTGFYLAVKRRSTTGFIILAATISLLPVLHILPVDFDQDLFHERQVTLALAVSCALLPLVSWPRANAIRGITAQVVRLLLPIAAALWLISCAVDIRTLIPHWANDVALWQWAVANDPTSLRAKDYLVMAYDNSGELDEALAFGDQLITDPVTCTSCMLHLAKIALNKNDLDRASAALDKASHSPLIKRRNGAQQQYLSTLGQLRNAQGRYREAKEALEVALEMNPEDKDAQRELSLANMSLEPKVQ